MGFLGLPGLVDYWTVTAEYITVEYFLVGSPKLKAITNYTGY